MNQSKFMLLYILMNQTKLYYCVLSGILFLKFLLCLNVGVEVELALKNWTRLQVFF